MVAIDMIATGQNIKRLRNSRRLTTADIQYAFGFKTPQAVYKWMNGSALPTIDNLVILADLLKVTIDDILVIRKGNG